MRISICLLALVGLVSCGGGGGDGGFDANAERAASVEFLERRSADGADSEILKSDNLPTGKVQLSGPVGARIGYSETALIGQANMTADFQAATVSGKVTNLGVYDVRGVSLYTAEATNERPLGGTLDINGTVIKSAPDTPGTTFNANYNGDLTGWPDQGAARVVAATQSGAFTEANGRIQGTGQVEGSVSFERGGSQNLTGGYLFVKE